MNVKQDIFKRNALYFISFSTKTVHKKQQIRSRVMYIEKKPYIDLLCLGK